MFIRKRLTKYRMPSYQLLESYREKGKVKQRIIFNLGRSPDLAGAKKRIEIQLLLSTGIADCKYLGTPEERTSAKAKVLQLQNRLKAIDKLFLTYKPIETPKPADNENQSMVEDHSVAFIDPLEHYNDDS